jgi:hypothetical protein
VDKGDEKEVSATQINISAIDTFLVSFLYAYLTSVKKMFELHLYEFFEFVELQLSGNSFNKIL